MRKLAGFIAALPLVFSFVLSYFQVTPPDYGEELQFDSSGEFNILIISGLMEGEGGFSYASKTYINDILSQTKPDLVVLGGNNIAPQPLITDLFLAYTMNNIDEYIKVFEDNKVYFTILFGDYDTKGLYDKSSQLKRYMRSKYFVGGISNSQNLNVLYDRRKNISGNFRIKILNDNNGFVYLYMIDYQSDMDLSDEQKAWFKNPLELPAYIFSYRNLYEKKDLEYNFLLNDKNARAYISANSKEHSDITLDNGLMLLSTAQSSSYDEGLIERSYTAKKIVLTNEGGLNIINY